MKFINTTGLHRKSGVAQWRDLRYSSGSQTGSAPSRPVPTLAAMVDENDREFFSSLSKREHEALAATLKKLVQAHGR